ncbi:hypothetical protein BK704_22125 [[Bacillus thuringiensis] serovar konkukian]|nr:hypothetical protein [Bacillus thuringiensis]MED1303709.1 hypothetical protein [Bacillus pacificus]OUA99702.1 hypothetical protein BK704_22125 [[Bacillus thuringiensis] serovar konkukian]
MILRDIGIELGYDPNRHISEIQQTMKEQNISQLQATQLYYKKNFQEKDRKIWKETRCIINLYLSYLGRYKTAETKQILIKLVKTIEGSQIINYDGFTDIQIVFNIDKYFSAAPDEKKKITLKLIHEAMSVGAKSFNWDHTVCQNSYDKVIEDNYKNNYVWKTKVSAGRKYIAEVYCEHDIHEYLIYIIIKCYRDKSEIKKVLLHKVGPHELDFASYLGDLKWLSNDSVALIGENPRKQWIVNL